MRGGSLGLILMLAPLVAGFARAAEPPRRDPEPLDQLAAVWPFLEDSPDARTDPATIGKFFTPEIYAKLRGNEYFGYTYDEGYTPPETKKIRLRLVQTLPALQRYEAAFLYALVAGGVRAGLKPDRAAQTDVGACLLGVDTVSRPGRAGVLIEAFVKNNRTGQARFIRFACGRENLDEAFLAAAEILMGWIAK